MLFRTDVSASQTSKSFKQKREEERKASEAGGDTRAWNSLYMRPDTVCFNLKHSVLEYSIVKLEHTAQITTIILKDVANLKLFFIPPGAGACRLY